jgi:hypothetical protein
MFVAILSEAGQAVKYGASRWVLFALLAASGFVFAAIVRIAEMLP